MTRSSTGDVSDVNRPALAVVLDRAALTVLSASASERSPRTVNSCSPSTSSNTVRVLACSPSQDHPSFSLLRIQAFAGTLIVSPSSEPPILGVYIEFLWPGGCQLVTSRRTILGLQ